MKVEIKEYLSFLKNFYKRGIVCDIVPVLWDAQRN